MSEPFFSRWSQRKQALAKGLSLEQPAAAVASGPPAASSNAGPDARANSDASRPVTQRDSAAGAGPVADHDADRSPSPKPDAAAPAPKLPTLDEARALTPKSDFQPFMRQGVASDVRNAAVKKLFADPHFNIMDGLDIYIGDYNTPDPLPAGMLKKMVGAQFLNLFPDEAKAPNAPKEPPMAGASPALSAPIAQSADQATEPRANPEQSPASPESAKDVAQSPALLPTPEVQHATALHAPALSQNDHPDLQLQPNHAPASPSSGQSTG